MMSCTPVAVLNRRNHDGAGCGFPVTDFERERICLVRNRHTCHHLRGHVMFPSVAGDVPDLCARLPCLAAEHGTPAHAGSPNGTEWNCLRFLRANEIRPGQPGHKCPMQRVVIDEPYEFIPPYRGRFWSWVCRHFLRGFLRREYGIVEWDCQGVEKLTESLRAGHGIIVAPNHPRPSDPLAMGIVSIEARTHLFTMASWHVFKQGGFQAYMIRRLGAFSVYREGMDRQALNCAIGILERAERPLVIFPEGVITRTNDRLWPLMDGIEFIARPAAKRRTRIDPHARVVVHPLALRYQIPGDIAVAIAPVIEEIEQRLSWRPQRHLRLVNRIRKLGSALIGLKEIEYFGRTRDGSIYDRAERLIDHLLSPLEREWLQAPQRDSVVGRVKRLRTAILPDMVNGGIDSSERDRRWRQLEDVYLAQQLCFYPRDYLSRDAPPERLLETVEKFEEDLTDRNRVHAELKLTIRIGDALDVSPRRDRGSDDEGLIDRLETDLGSMLIPHELTADAEAAVSNDRIGPA